MDAMTAMTRLDMLFALEGLIQVLPRVQPCRSVT